MKTASHDKVKEMFDGVAKNYDFLNRLLSLRIDVLWRKRLIKKITQNKCDNVLDVATGTADLSITLALKSPESKIIGLDPSKGMIEIGAKKIERRKLKNIKLELGRSEDLRFEDNSFDIIMVGFGVRNFENLKDGLKEFKRVLKQDGKLFVLEFSIPSNKIFKSFYLFYFKYILPSIGKLISGKSEAYRYLPDTVQTFPHGAKFGKILEEIGFSNIKINPLTFGIATIYETTK